jgi:hypothetical protein
MTDAAKPEPELGDVNPELSELQRLDPLGFAQLIASSAKEGVIEGVIADNPGGDMDDLNDEVQETLHQAELGLGLIFVHEAAALKKAAYLASDDMYHSFPLEEMRRVLEEEGFSRVYWEDISVPDDPILHQGEYRPRPEGRFEIWFNSEGTLLHFDTSPAMDYTGEDPLELGQLVNGATLYYNWTPDPRSFVYYSEREGDLEWRQHVDTHHYSNFTSSGHFLTQSDDEWEDLSKRVWVGVHHFVEGGLRHALHNLRQNGSFLPKWREAPGTTEFRHWGDRRRTADYLYKEHPEALLAAKDQLQMQIRHRYDSLPDGVKTSIGPFHTWETKRTLGEGQEKPALEQELPSLDYLADEPGPGPERTL